MNNYQKAIKVRKVCEKYKNCNYYNNNCPYRRFCVHSEILFYKPIEENINRIAKTIKEEKWKVD